MNDVMNIVYIVLGIIRVIVEIFAFMALIRASENEDIFDEIFWGVLLLFMK